jgi:hypothetical protein
MVLRNFPLDLTDPNLVAAAEAEGVSPAVAAAEFATLPQADIEGFKQFVTTDAGYGADAAAWRAAWASLAGKTDKAVRVLQRWVALETGTFVADVP